MNIPRDWFTVPDVARELRIEPVPAVMWAVGAAAREVYRATYGELPPKDNARKTNGPGSHCFAHYPPHFRDKVREIFGSVQTEASRQLALF